MSRLYHEALTVVKTKLHEQDPAKANALNIKTSAAALRNPDDRRNTFYATVEWPTDGDSFSTVGLRANFPRERRKNGEGYLGVIFSSEERIDASRIDTKLKIYYGIGEIGLLEPMGVDITETLEGTTGEQTEPLWSPASSEAAAAILARFGIVES